MASGAMAPIPKVAAPRLMTKPAKTFIMVCPAIILANNRMDSETGRDKYEMISITIMNGTKTLGAPWGTKELKKCRPWVKMPSKVTPMNTASAMAKVTMMWLVKVKLYGIMPSRLPNRIKRKRINGI